MIGHQKQDNLSEWLRRQTRNLLGFARAGSNPAVVVFIHLIIAYPIVLLVRLTYKESRCLHNVDPSLRVAFRNNRAAQKNYESYNALSVIRVLFAYCKNNWNRNEKISSVLCFFDCTVKDHAYKNG